MITLISLAGNTVSLVNLPNHSGVLQSMDWTMFTGVATVLSTFTGQVQAQQWPGLDLWSVTCTLPPLRDSIAKQWSSTLMQMQGMLNACQLGDPQRTAPGGAVQGTPIVDPSIPMLAGGQVLYTAGWTPSKSGLLLQGDHIQIGYRLHQVLDTVNSDANGKAAISIWPSLREVPQASGPVITSNPVGLFRLKTNSLQLSKDVTGLTHMSFQFQEYR